MSKTSERIQRKNVDHAGPEPLIPFQVKTKPETREKIERIARKNGLSLNDVAAMALAAGIGMVETKLQEIHEPVTA